MHPVVVQTSAVPRISVIGDQQRLLLTGAQTRGAFALIEELNEPGTGVPPHVHEREDETFHIVEGEVQFELNPGSAHAQTFVAGAGTTVLAPRNVPHRWQVVGAAPARVLLFVTPAGCEAMFRELAALSGGPPDPSQLHALTAICARYGVRILLP